MAAPAELAEAAFTGTGLKVEHLVVNLTVPAVKPVRVTLRGGGRSGGALRFYDEDPDNPGYALTSDAGSTSVARWIPAGDTILTLAAGALRDRVDNGDSGRRKHLAPATPFLPPPPRSSSRRRTRSTAARAASRRRFP